MRVNDYLIGVYFEMEVRVNDCNGNPFWAFFAQKDCSGKRGPKGNAQINFLVIISETTQLIHVTTPVFIDFYVSFQVNLLAEKLL